MPVGGRVSNPRVSESLGAEVSCSEAAVKRLRSLSSSGGGRREEELGITYDAGRRKGVEPESL